MKTFKGTIRYKGKVYKYSVEFSKSRKSGEFRITDLRCANGENFSAGAVSSALEELVIANAQLLKWCEDEGWQPYPSHEEVSGFARCPDGYTQRIRKADVLAPPETMTEPMVVEVLNWAEELVEEPVYYKGGIDQFLGSGKYEAFVPYEEPASVLKAGVLYFGENGMIVCRKCAGVRESSGYLSSGESVMPVSQADMAEFKKMFGEEMGCEKGCS